MFINREKIKTSRKVRGDKERKEEEEEEGRPGSNRGGNTYLLPPQWRKITQLMDVRRGRRRSDCDETESCAVKLLREKPAWLC